MMIKTALSLLSVATLVTKSNANTIRDPAGDAAAACAKLNLTEQLSLMRGFGPINGYSRNSGCGGVCGRDTFRWDNGPEGLNCNEIIDRGRASKAPFLNSREERTFSLLSLLPALLFF